MENSNDTGTVIGALIVGGLIGATLGILFAPDKGSRTRSKLVGGAKDLADDIRKQMKDQANALRIKAEELENLAEQKMEDVLDSVKQNVEMLKNHN